MENMEKPDVDAIFNGEIPEVLDIQDLAASGHAKFVKEDGTEGGRASKPAIRVTPMEFPDVMHDERLRPQGGGDIGPIGRLILRYQRGALTKEQALKSIRLAFNTEFEYLSLAAATHLSHAKKELVHQYTLQTNELNKNLSRDLGKQLVQIVDVFWEGVERAAKGRAATRARLQRLREANLLSPAEVAVRLREATEDMEKIEASMRKVTSDLITDVLDKVQHALDTKVKDLVGKDLGDEASLLAG